MSLLSNFGKRGISLGLAAKQTDIYDTDHLSKYFVVTEFNQIFTAGKNSVAFNGSALLKPKFAILIECIDSKGIPLYIERSQTQPQKNEASKYVVSIHVYRETSNGSGKLIFTGTTITGATVKWSANITIDKNIQNSSKIRFYNTPTIEVRPLLYPVIIDTVGKSLAKQIIYTGSFSTYAITPLEGTNQTTIKSNEPIDYRLVTNDYVLGEASPTSSFNTQMEGQAITLNTSIITAPSTKTAIPHTSSVQGIIQKVVNDSTIILTTPYFTPVKQNNLVTNINSGSFTSSYKFIAYNNQSESYQTVTPVGKPDSEKFYFKDSYAEITYRNIKPFTGFIARHKLYKKSQLYLGDYSLVIDEPLGTMELLADPVSSNKSYSTIGSFYNSTHIAKYWYTSSNNIATSHQSTPRINSMRISSTINDNSIVGDYVIAKTDAIQVIGDNKYYPYNKNEYDQQSGSGYTSNFIDLKAGSLYVLSTNITIEKEPSEKNVSVSFFLTSSIPSITKEKTFDPVYGLKLGEISTSDKVKIKTFSDKQYLYFTPQDDYYGTLLIVPNKCNVILSELSLMAYGDYGFSPDVLVTKIPFPIHLANEPFLIKTELFDINSNLVYSGLQTIQEFDPKGDSLHANTGSSNLIDLSLTGSSALNNDYISMTWYNSTLHAPVSVTALAVKYDGINGIGRKIYIDKDGTKYISNY